MRRYVHRVELELFYSKKVDNSLYYDIYPNFGTWKTVVLVATRKNFWAVFNENRTILEEPGEIKCLNEYYG